MSLNTKIFTTFTKPDATEVSARAVQVREGFSWAALAFGVLWLVWNRLWVATIFYVLIVAGIVYAGERFALSEMTLILLQLFVQIMLAFSAFDLKRLSLRWRGYKFAGVVVAESSLNAERRYYDHVA